RDGPDVVLPAADETDGAPEGRAQEVEPLADEIQRRRDHERRSLLCVDRHERDVTLAGAGRQDDDAATALRVPGRERLALVVPGLAVNPGGRRQLGIGA